MSAVAAGNFDQMLLLQMHCMLLTSAVAVVDVLYNVHVDLVQYTVQCVVLTPARKSVTLLGQIFQSVSTALTL